MKMTKLNKDDKDRLGVLWVLLNISNEIGDPEKTIALMDAIKRIHKNAPKMWRKKFDIVVEGKIVYKFSCF